MRINSLRLQNFRQHQSAVIEFGDGVTGIIGPNGAGKSTILEAIAWALYGNSAARGTRDSIRFSRSVAGTPVRVELDFELAGHRYRVVRQLTSAQVYLDNASAPIASSLTGVSELLQRKLGMTRSEFFNTYFTGQKELNVMAAMGPTDRAQFLSRVLGYERLRSAQKLARERRLIITAEATGLKGALPDPETVERALEGAEDRLRVAIVKRGDAERLHTVATTALAEVSPRWEALQRERDRLQELTAELRVAESEEVGFSRDVERLSRALEEAKASQLELEALRVTLEPYARAMAEFQRLEKLAREEGRRATLAETVRVINDELARLAERAEKVEDAPVVEQATTVELETRRRELDVVQLDLEERRTLWVRDRQEAETKRDDLRRAYAELQTQREQLVALGEEGICPTCTRPLGANYRTVLDDVDEKLATIVVDGRYFANRLEQLEKVPDELRMLEERRKELATTQSALERKLAKCQAAVQERLMIAREIEAKTRRHTSVSAELAEIPAGYDATRHGALKGEVERLAAVDARAARISAMVEREPQTRREYDLAVKQLGYVQEKHQGLRAKHEVLAFDEERFGRAKAEYEGAATHARAVELTLVKAKGEEDASRMAAESARRASSELGAMRGKLDDLQRRKRLHDEIDRAYSDLRTELNFQLRPEVSEIASAFLAQLTDGRYAELELDDQYNVVVLEDGTPKPVISGGEEDLANLVLRLAISQMIADRAGQNFSLLILDEVFGSLDEVRRATVMELLRRLQDRFEQVIIITHIENVREGLDRVITVRYDETTGAAVVEGGRLFDAGESDADDLTADAEALPSAGAGEAA